MKGGPKARKIVRKVNLDASDKLLFDITMISTARSQKTRLIQHILNSQFIDTPMLKIVFRIAVLLSWACLFIRFLKIKVPRNIARLAFVFVFAVFLGIFPLHEIYAKTIISQFDHKDNPITKATVIIIPEPHEALFSVEENDLKKAGCYFFSKENFQIKNLIKTLRKANFEETTKRDSAITNLRQGVFLDFADGTQLKVLFNLAPPNESSSGFIIKGLSQEKTYFTAQPVGRDLIAWASFANETLNDSDLTGALELNCKKFLSNRK